jgi:putative ABC transport system permease protein
MEELFGISMNRIMLALLAIFALAFGTTLVMALRNPIMVKLALRNIPRRKAQTVLIILGIMISGLIMSAAFGTGDTITFSLRSEAIKTLGTIDEAITRARVSTDDRFGSSAYFPQERFLELEQRLSGVREIDGLAPQLGETVPTVNPRTSLSEGSTRMVGVNPTRMAGFAPQHLVTGEPISLDTLAEGEVYINDKAAEELDAVIGDRLQVFLPDGTTRLVLVKGIVPRGGLAGRDPTILAPLEQMQALVGRPVQINLISVSNRGDAFQGAKLSEEVTRMLRVIFADRTVATQLQQFLSQEPVLEALEKQGKSLGGALKQDFSVLLRELQGGGGPSDTLVSLLADTEVSDQVLKALENQGLLEELRDADTLFANLGEFQVFDIKRQVLDQADLVGSFITTFFIVMGLFSIMVGVLLIFLIFVMLAAARRTEMGMARAVGAKRAHLVQMFLFEGTAYSLLSAAIGVALGLLVSSVIVVVANQFISGSPGTDDDFHLSRHFELRSVIVAYCLGMVISFATVSFSAFQVSRLNIVSAVRGLPTPTVTPQRRWLDSVLAVGHALFRTVRLVHQALRTFAHLHLARALATLAQTGGSLLVIPATVVTSLAQVLWRPITQGWLTLILGALLTWASVSSHRASFLRLGISLALIGLGLMLRTLLQRTPLREEVRDRVAYTFIGLTNLAFWLLPIRVLRALAGELEPGIELFFISGISMVAAAVWTIMYNADLVLKLLTFISRPIARLRPVVVTAVAYPMSAKFRTGLTLAMFALVIFTLMILSILTNAFNSASADVRTVTGNWDIEATINPLSPIEDIRQAIAQAKGLQLQDFQAIGGYTTIPIEARQVGAEEQRWRRYLARLADDAFLATTEYKLKLVADGYGPDRKDVYEALRQDAMLAVVDASVVPFRGGFGDGSQGFKMEGFYYDDERIPPIEIEVREPRTGTIARLTVIGALDQISDSYVNQGLGLVTSRANLERVFPFPVPITTYRFRLGPGVEAKETARRLEAAFRQHGMETEVLKELVDESVAANRAFNYLFTGFMGLGLMVGVAALGVVSLRAVVERRQQIGVLRAIGYRRSMIQWSFLLESSFVALLGIAIGVTLGSTLSYLIVDDIREQADIENLRFSIPWIQITAIVLGAYLFSLLTTWLPARQASRIHPAEALRYE